MRLAIFKGEKSLDDLAARLFLVSDGDPQVSKRATDALIEANPQLANLDRVPSGSVVVLPDMPHSVNAAEVVQPTTTAAADFARSVAEHVTAFTSGLADAVGSAATQADSNFKLLQDRSLKAAADSDPALKQRLTAIEADTKATLEDVNDRQKTLQPALAQMQEDLAQFFPPSALPSPVPSPSPAPPPSTPQPPSGGPPLQPTPGPQRTPRPTATPPAPRHKPTATPPAPAIEPSRASAKPTAKTPARRGRRKTKPK